MRIIDDQTVEATVTFDEPDTAADGTPIATIAYYTVSYQIGSNPPVAIQPRGTEFPFGGTNIAFRFPLPAPKGQVTTATFWVTATDVLGITSVNSTTVTNSFDRTPPSQRESALRIRLGIAAIWNAV